MRAIHIKKDVSENEDSEEDDIDEVLTMEQAVWGSESKAARKGDCIPYPLTFPIYIPDLHAHALRV